MKITITIDDEELKTLIKEAIREREKEIVEDSISPEDVAKRNLIAKTHDMKITDLGFVSQRSYNALKSIDIETVETLLRFTPRYLIRVRNLGRKSIAEIESLLTSNGFQFGSLPPIWVREGDRWIAKSDYSASKLVTESGVSAWKYAEQLNTQIYQEDYKGGI